MLDEFMKEWFAYNQSNLHSIEVSGSGANKVAVIRFKQYSSFTGLEITPRAYTVTAQEVLRAKANAQAQIDTINTFISQFNAMT